MSSILTALSDIPVNKPMTAGTPGRKAVISRDDIIEAALKLAGPNRSVSSLSLREVAREAGIAPNSFYRQFRDMDELAVALRDIFADPGPRLLEVPIDRAGTAHW